MSQMDVELIIWERKICQLAKEICQKRASHPYGNIWRKTNPPKTWQHASTAPKYIRQNRLTVHLISGGTSQASASREKGSLRNLLSSPVQTRPVKFVSDICDLNILIAVSNLSKARVWYARIVLSVLISVFFFIFKGVVLRILVRECACCTYLCLRCSM